MNFKKWNIAFLGLACAVLVLVASVNYFVDPFGYFAFQAGDYDTLDSPMDTTYYQRELKAEHVLKFEDNYDAYLLGGSKGGSYLTEKLQELDGYRYYNMYEVGGSFYEYAMETAFLIENANPKKIIINISGGEVRLLQRNQDDVTFRIPAVMSGESKLLEFVDFLFKDIRESIDRIEERLGDETNDEFLPTGARNLSRYYKKIEEDWTKLTNNNVLKSFDSHMERLFTTEVAPAYTKEALDYMESIKEMCEENGVELMVIVAPSFIGEMSEHDGEVFWDFLERLALITDYWDFSGYHDIDLNPYNFYNEGHFYYEITDAMVDVINGTEVYPGFGTYVTMENVAEHVSERAADYYRLKEEYDSTGTIALQGMEDASCLVK